MNQSRFIPSNGYESYKLQGPPKINVCVCDIQGRHSLKIEEFNLPISCGVYVKQHPSCINNSQTPNKSTSLCPIHHLPTATWSTAFRCLLSQLISLGGCKITFFICNLLPNTWYAEDISLVSRVRFSFRRCRDRMYLVVRLSASARARSGSA